MNNTQKTIKNSAISVIAQMCTLFLQFINRRIFVVFLDIEYLGYESLFSNVFSLLSVAELGIGNIIAFHLYQEVVKKKHDEIGKLMYLYKWMYRVVAGVVLISGIICSFFLSSFVKDATASWDYLYLIYFLQLAGVFFGYFLSYKRTLFIATQQEYKCVQTDLFVSIAIQVLQLCALAVFKNYLVYLCIHISTTILSNLIISEKYKKAFPYVKNKYSIPKEYIKSRNMFADFRDILIHKICYAVYGGTDNVIISAVCGVRMVAYYSNYVMVQRGVMQILFYKLLNPVQATIGNIVHSDRSKDELWEQFKMLDVFSFFFGSFIGIGFFVFYQPFIHLWMGQEYLLPNSFVTLFSVTIYLGAVWEIVYKYRGVFGDYKQDRGMMVLSAILNIAISIPGAKLWGVTGVQFGTLIAFLPIAYGRIRFVVKNYFGQSVPAFFLRHLCLLVIVSIEGILCRYICDLFPVSITGLVFRGLVLLSIPTILNCLIFVRDTYFKNMINYLVQFFHIVVKK